MKHEERTKVKTKQKIEKRMHRPGDPNSTGISPENTTEKTITTTSG